MKNCTSNSCTNHCSRWMPLKSWPSLPRLRTCSIGPWRTSTGRRWKWALTMRTWLSSRKTSPMPKTCLTSSCRMLSDHGCSSRKITYCSPSTPWYSLGITKQATSTSFSFSSDATLLTGSSHWDSGRLLTRRLTWSHRTLIWKVLLIRMHCFSGSMEGTRWMSLWRPSSNISSGFSRLSSSVRSLSSSSLKATIYIRWWMLTFSTSRDVMDSSTTKTRKYR